MNVPAGPRKATRVISGRLSRASRAPRRPRRCRRRRRSAPVEDRRLGVGVDGDDRPGRLHPGEVLHGTGDAEREVDLRLDGLAGLTDLAGGGHPAGVDERARDAERRAHLLGQLLELLDVVLLADAAADREQELRLGDVDVAALGLDELAVLRARGGGSDAASSRDRRASGALGRLPRRGAQHEDGRLLAGELELGPDLRAVHLPLGDEAAVVSERHHVGGEAEPQAGGERRCEAHRADGEPGQDDRRLLRGDERLGGAHVRVGRELGLVDANGHDFVDAGDVRLLRQRRRDHRRSRRRQPALRAATPR